MMPPGFGPDCSRSSDGGSHGLAALRFPYGEVPRMEAVVPAFHSECYSRQGPPSQIEKGNGRPQRMMAAGTIGMPSPGRSAPAEVWDIKAMAAHRHRALLAESSAQRMEARMQTIPPHACPPGFRPPPLHSESPLPNMFPPGFRPPSVYNEPVLPQSCPPGFRPPIQYTENSAIIQPEMKFRSADPIIYRPEFRLDDRPGDPIGIHDTMRGSSMYGATDRRGWYPNESSSGAGRVYENRFVDPQVSKPYILLSQPQDEHLPNQSRGAKLENENWRRETLPEHARPLSPSVPVSKATPPLASYPEAFWPGNIRDDNLASTREAGKRRSFEGSDNTSRTPPFKRPRIGHEVDSPSWARSRRDPEFERTWSDGLRRSGDRSRDCEGSHPSSLHTQKQTERRNMTESSDRTVDRWRDRQELTTQRSSPHNQRGPLSPRDRNRAPFSLEVSQKSELPTRPSSFRPISQSDRSSLRAPPRPVRSNGREKQQRNIPYFDTRSRPSSRGSWSPRLSLRSRSPNGHPNYDRRSLRVDERSLRKDSWSPRLLAGKSSSAAETDEHAAHWRSVNIPGKVERRAEQNGSSTTLHSSRAVGEFGKDERSRSDSQVLDVVAKHQSQQRGTEGNVVQKANNSLDSIAPASTDKIKNEKALSLPLRAGTIQKLPEMETKAEQRGSLEKNWPLHKNCLKFFDEKASSSSAKHMTTTGEDQSASIQPVSAKSLKITRHFTYPKSLRVLKYHISQDLEVEWKTPPEKVTPRRRRTVVVSADPPLAKISGSDEGAALPPKEREANITKISSPTLGQKQDELRGGILHTEKSSKSLLGPRLLLERSSIASEIGIIEEGLTKPFVDLSRVSSEATVHPPSLVHGTDSQLTTVSEVGSGVNDRTGQKVIFTGHRSKHIPSVELRKMASGSDLQSPESLGKSQTPDRCLLAEDAPGYSCSQQMEELLPTLTVRKGRVSSHAGVKKLSNNPSVPRSDLSSLDKDQEIFTAGKIKFEGASSKASATVLETQKLPFVAEKSLLQESPAHGQNLERDQLASSGTEGQLMSSRSFCVGDTRVNPSVGESAPFLDEFVGREVLLFGTNLNASTPLATETNEGFQPNGSTSDSLHVSVKSELQDSLSSGGDNQAEQLGGLAREKTSVLELAKVMTDKEEAAVVQGKQDMKVVPQPSYLRNASATEGDKVARQLDREVREQADSVTKLASFLTDAGAAIVTKGAEVMSIVPQLSDLQDSTTPGGNNRAEQKGKLTMGGSASATKLVRAMTGEGEAIVTERKEGFEVITQPSGEVVATVFDREVGKRRKIVRPEKGGNLKRVIIAEDATANGKKTNVLGSSSGTEKIKADSILVKNQMPSLKGGIQRTVPVLKTVDTLPLSSHLSVPPAVTPPLGTVGRSYRSNKTWRREAMPVSTQRFSNTPRQRPAVVAQPSTYVRKKFSIIRYPVPQVPLQSNVGAQPNALSKFPQESVTQSGNKKYSLSASKSMGHHQVNTISTKTAGAASPNVKTSNTKMSELGAMPSEKPRSSSVRRLNPVGDETLVTRSESIVSDLPPVTKISPSKPSHCEGSSGLATLACSPASKSSVRATDEAVGYVVSGSRLYRKRKSNQVLVGPSPTSASPILRSGLEKCDVPLGYIKRKTNQLVRCSPHREASANDALQNVVEGGDQVKFMNRQRRYSAQLKTKTKLGRVLSQKKGRILGLARVWTLSNEGKHTTAALGSSRDWRYPLFPWKKVDVVAPRVRRGRPLHEGKMGALFFHISNQLQRYRSAHPVYTRSADGFSLHRSGVVSKSGANLKWTKSLKTQSILASEAATKVVAEAEKKKRDKKEAVVMAVAKVRDERRALQASAKQAKLRSGSVDPSSVSSLKPLGIGGAVYVRKGFGNQLVRNLRTVARAVASEKFRWSLRNARLRRAKKQAFCVYYTRFGVCKRGDGKCLYIHDPEKVAVCTKFLRGSCSDPACRLTHKVIPERMSDCSYFLEGLCTNESCPYRHVNVNPKAPICEGFLQGYCADGDMCNKKHTYVCPEYTLAGKCSSSNCKLRHPKKTKQPTSASKDSVGSKREGRYFTLTAPAEGDYQGQPVSTANAVGDKIAESGDDRIDFISIDEYDSESSKEYQDTGTL